MSEGQEASCEISKISYKRVRTYGLKNCSQRCIIPGEPCKIQKNPCLYCGNYASMCPLMQREKE